MDKLQHRVNQYSSLSTDLFCLSSSELIQILAEAEPLHQGIGGKSVLIHRNETPVFVKKIPLTSLEQIPENVMSTKNIFDLPLCYQYGVGSAGFGAWRELASHIITTNWVLERACENFPLLYHWCVLPRPPEEQTLNYWGDKEKYSHYWENCPAINKRVESLDSATDHIALFLEYIPYNLQDFLERPLLKGGSSAETTVIQVAKELKCTTDFMSQNNFIHFDAHFKNILTDGERLYFSDFGLALSTKFSLSPLENDFFKLHKTYDQACAAVNLMQCIITSLYGKDQWKTKLHYFLTEDHAEIKGVLKKLIESQGPLALLMDDFFQKLQKESKLTPYPYLKVNQLLSTVKNKL